VFTNRSLELIQAERPAPHAIIEQAFADLQARDFGSAGRAVD